MRRWQYQVALWALFPFLLWRAYRQSRQLRARPHAFKQRFGAYTGGDTQGVWLHMVSVGESRAAYPLLTWLQQTYPQLPRLVTNGSLNGVEQVALHAPVSLTQQLLPYDYPWALQRFFQAVQPRALVIVETELWPNLLQQARRYDVPVLLINARLSDRSYARYQRFAQPLLSEAINKLHWIGAQSERDARRFIDLGADPKLVQVIGNLKFDAQPVADVAPRAQQWRTCVAGERFVWVAGSTHAGEEALLLQAHQRLRAAGVDALLVLVPRAPERFAEVAQLITDQAMTWHAQSQGLADCPAGVSVVLGDMMGQLLTWYAAADAAFVGGSLVSAGGHNILEPAAFAKPVISGPYDDDMREMFATMQAHEGLTRVSDVSALIDVLTRWAKDPSAREAAGQRALSGYQSAGGALRDVTEKLADVLDR